MSTVKRSSDAYLMVIWSLACGAAPLLVPTTAQAQLNDLTQSPNTANAGILKSYEAQIGAGRGDLMTPLSSMFIIKRDPFRSVRRGRQLFQRKFTLAQGVGPRTGDGVGDIETHGSIGAGLADSCAACHGRPRGAAGFGGDVFTRPDSRDSPHLFGLGLTEMLADEITHDLRAIRDQAIAQAQSQGFAGPALHTDLDRGDVGGDGDDSDDSDDDDDDDDDDDSPDGTGVTRDLVSKGISYGTITAFADGTVDLSNVEGVNPDLRVRPFFAEGSTISIREFIVGALNAEMGLESPDPDLLAASSGMDVVTPSGMVLSGSIDTIESPPVSTELEDGDNDGVTNEVPTAIVDHMEFYLLNYFKAGRHDMTDDVSDGRSRFIEIGCAACHIPDLLIVSDRRVADVETAYDADAPGFNHLFATAEARFGTIEDDSGHPDLKLPQGNSFLVKNIYADFKRHDLGPNFYERNFDGSITTEFMTEALWGVGSTPPYGHDGRSINLTEVILRHGGEAQASRAEFEDLDSDDRNEILAFLNSLVLFPPDDTASNLNPGDADTPGFPQFGHGSINLGALFNDPSEGE